MTYTELTAHMHEYRMGRMTWYEMGCKIHEWQRACGYIIATVPGKSVI